MLKMICNRLFFKQTIINPKKGDSIMNKSYLLRITLIVTTLNLACTSIVNANDCTVALASIDQIIVKADIALSSNDFEQVGDIANDLKVNAQQIIKAADSCDCDSAYYTAEAILENAEAVYLADDMEESVGFINSLKKEANSAIKYAKTCGSLVAKT
jgi:hypothetical protein